MAQKTELCPACGGSGWEDQFIKPCTECNGIGKKINIKKVGLKYDDEKIRMDLLPFDALAEIGKVLTFGAKKYSDNSWQNLENGQARYSAAMLRHYAAIQSGEIIDKESGLPHAAHMATNAMFLLWLELHKNDKVENK
jgi:hypothetical protein